MSKQDNNLIKNYNIDVLLKLVDNPDDNYRFKIYSIILNLKTKRDRFTVQGGWGLLHQIYKFYIFDALGRLSRLTTFI